jgi:hypothetical protein
MSSDGYSDYERIELFLERVEKLKNNSLNSEGKLKRISSLSKFDEEKGHWHEILGADNQPINMESFEALVAAFRLVYMDKEPTFIEYVYDVVYTSLDPAHHHKIQHFKDNWQRALDEDSHFVAEDGGYIKLDKVLKNWLYGELFHSDKAKREFVKRWGKPLEGEVVMIINFLSHYIFQFKDFIIQALDQKWLVLSHTTSTPRSTK